MVDDRAQERRRRADRRRRRGPRPRRGASTPRRTSSTRTDFRARARAFREAFADYDVFYAGKAFLCTADRAVGRRGGSQPRRLLRRRARPWRCGPASTRPGSATTATTRPTPSCARAVAEGVGRIVVDSFVEIERLAQITERARAAPAACMVRVTAGVEAHTHEYIATAHEDQKFGFSITTGDACEAVRRVQAAPGLELLGLHSHIGSQIFDSSGLRGRRPPGARPARPDQRRARRRRCPSSTSAAASASPTRPRTTRPTPRSSPPRSARSSSTSAGRSGIDGAAAVDRARPRDRRPVDVHGLHGRHGQAGRARRRRRAHLRLGRRRDERQHPHRALRRRLLLHARQPRARPPPPVLSRVVGKHCEAGDIVVKDEFLPGDVRPGDLVAVPGTGAYCRSMASNYNHALRPPVVAVRDGVARVVVRRETEDDLFATDMGVPEVEQRRLSRWPSSAAGRSAPRWSGCSRSRPATSRRGSARRSSWSASPYAASTRPARSRCPTGCSPPTRPALVARDDVDVVVEVIGGIEPARSLILAALENGASVVTANKALLAEDGPTRLRGRREGRPRPLLRGRGRRRHPDPAPAARVAGRRPGHPGARHRQRHHQLHPRQDGHPGHGLLRGAGGGPGARLRRGRPDRRRRGLRRRGEGRDPRLARVPLPGHRRRRAPRGHLRGHRRRRPVGQGHGQRGQAAGDLRAQRRRRGLGPRPPGDDPRHATRWPSVRGPTTRSSSSPRPPAS